MTRTQSDREFDWSTGRELERKDAEIERLRAALAFYANEMNWAEAGGFTAAAVEDGGKIARGADVQKAGEN